MSKYSVRTELAYIEKKHKTKDAKGTQKQRVGGCMEEEEEEEKEEEAEVGGGRREDEYEDEDSVS